MIDEFSDVTGNINMQKKKNQQHFYKPNSIKKKLGADLQQ